jgi:histidyl-tRNA synthetase
MSFKAPRGVADILPDEQPAWEFVRSTAARVAERFGYRRIDTPVFEDTALFRRGVGEDTDIVQKEMYSFQDLGGDSLTLRPEGTASVCRAYMEHGMASWPKPVRLYYLEPMFRYERPQAGRFRQFHQFGVELFGDASAQVDVEVIELGWLFLRELGLKNLTLRVNSIGDAHDRARHLQALRDYYSKHAPELPQVDRDRLDRSPLRLLDSKEPESQSLAENAPRSVDYLSDASRRRWDDTLLLLDGLKAVYPDMTYTVDHRLVRGLDYYTHTVFEIEPEGGGGQSALLGGGRYDGLMEALGGQLTPGTGFAAGLERLVLNLQRQGAPVPPATAVNVVAIPLGEASTLKAVELAAALRLRGVSTVLAPAGRSLKDQLRFANTLSARYALILGERELQRGVAALKALAGDGGQVETPLDPDAILAAMSGDTGGR